MYVNIIGSVVVILFLQELFEALCYTVFKKEKNQTMCMNTMNTQNIHL